MTASKDATTASLDQIQNIITGDQERENKKRFKTVEDRLGKEVSDLRAELKKQLQKQAEIGKAFDAKLAEVTERHSRELKRLASDQKLASETLKEEIVVSYNELGEENELGLQEIRDTMVCKEDLSGFFAEIALKLVNKKQIRRPN